MHQRNATILFFLHCEVDTSLNTVEVLEKVPNSILKDCRAGVINASLPEWKLHVKHGQSLSLYIFYDKICHWNRCRWPHSQSKCLLKYTATEGEVGSIETEFQDMEHSSMLKLVWDSRELSALGLRFCHINHKADRYICKQWHYIKCHEDLIQP